MAPFLYEILEICTIISINYIILHRYMNEILI